MKYTKLQYGKSSNVKIFFSAFFTGFVIVLFLLIASVMLFYSPRHTYYNIQGQSMEPGISSSNEACFIENNTVGTYGDIVVAYDKTVHLKGPVIKRIIAMQGDRIGFWYNAEGYYQIVLIKANSQTPEFLDETYLYQGITNKQEQLKYLKNNEYCKNKFLNNKIKQYLEDVEVEGQTIKMYTIPSDQIFLLGDNRKESYDCSSYGAIAVASVEGKVDQVFSIYVPTLFVGIKGLLGF